MTLRNKQKAFVEGYLRCWNATEAAREAGYSPRTAKSIGSENLTKPDIQAEIINRLREHHMSSDEALMLLSDIARADISDFIADNGSINWEAVRKNGRLIKKIKHIKGQHSEIELHDSLRALEMIGKFHRLFLERYEVEGKLSVVGLDEILERAYGKKE